MSVPNKSVVCSWRDVADRQLSKIVSFGIGIVLLVRSNRALKIGPGGCVILCPRTVSTCHIYSRLVDGNGVGRTSFCARMGGVEVHHSCVGWTVSLMDRDSKSKRKLCWDNLKRQPTTSARRLMSWVLLSSFPSPFGPCAHKL